MKPRTACDFKRSAPSKGFQFRAAFRIVSCHYATCAMMLPAVSSAT